MVIDENGILTRTIDAKDSTKSAQEIEKIKLAVTDALANENGEIKDLEKAIRNQGLDGNLMALTDGWKYIGEYNSYKIEKNGKVTNIDNINQYVISNLEELKTFRDEVNAGTFTGYDNDNTAYLEADIDLSNEENWIPIGTSNNPFMGIFNGNEHKISNLNINSTSDGAGLFGYSDGEINGVIIYSGNINSNNVNLGAICGKSSGIVKKCTNYANINSTSNYSAGIVGNNVGNIENCKNFGKINGKRWVGGIAGFNSKAQISNCCNEGDIIGTKDVGGITGESINGASIKVCLNTKEIIGETWVGGITGSLHTNSILDSCYNLGEIVGTESVCGRYSRT